MCSFLFFLSKRSNIKTSEALNRANRYMVRRGPDASNAVSIGDAILLHNLLHISGPIALAQPIADETESVIGLFNGEIYNYKDIAPEAQCDTECILTAYRRYGHTFAQYLDGEFAIVLWDRDSHKLIATTDVFMTKPLHMSVSQDEIAFASYVSALEELGFRQPSMCRPNTTYVYNVSNLDAIELEGTHQVRSFNLEQFKTTTDDWDAAFIESVRKRATHGNTEDRLFVNLSSGYDSGAIALAMNLCNLPYASFSSFKNEDPNVLNARIIRNRLANCTFAFQIAELSDTDREYEACEIHEVVEPFTYVHDDAPGMQLRMHDDCGAKAMNYITRFMSMYAYRIVLSGSGADEILSDYGFDGIPMYYHSQFGGRFPRDLATIFPWKKFYDDTQRSYLFKDEYIAGAHQIEGRYPFLDPNIVQEFLSLTHDVKNSTYKAPIAGFLKKHNYPILENVKKGFHI